MPPPAVPSARSRNQIVHRVVSDGQLPISGRLSHPSGRLPSRENRLATCSGASVHPPLEWTSDTAGSPWRSKYILKQIPRQPLGHGLTARTNSIREDQLRI